MKTTQTIKCLLLGSIVSFTFASCGGGADDAVDKLADVVDKNTTTQSNTLAPDALNAGMKFYITEASRPDSVLSITSATACTDSIAGECTYTYRKITNSSAKLNVQWGDYQESYTLGFKSMTSGNAVWIWSSDGKERIEDVKFRLEGRSSTPESSEPSDTEDNDSPAVVIPDTPPADDSSTDNGGDTDSSDDSVTLPPAPDNGLSPSSIPSRMQIRFGRYLVFRQDCVIENGTTHRRDSFNYRKTGKDTATLRVTYMAPSSNGLQALHTANVKLTFKSKETGTAEYTIENIDSFTFSNGIRKVTGGGQFFYEQY